jgi:NitT/TauT family transport system ATP-binding protein
VTPSSEGARPAPGSELLVGVEHVSHTFPGGVEALRDVGFGIAGGEFVSLLGASGCGKSTLLRLIAQLATPSSGVIRLGPAAASRGGIGFVFQDPTLLPWATVERNVMLPLELLGVARDAARPRVAEALELVGLSAFARAWPRELSGGMRMRVSLARALAQKPRLLLLDEPFAALDELTRFKLNDDLLRLWRRETWTVVFVTHSVFESVFLSQRVLVMTARPGRLHADLRVDLPAERDPSLRTSSHAYIEQCRIVSDQLARAVVA